MIGKVASPIIARVPLRTICTILYAAPLLRESVQIHLCLNVIVAFLLLSFVMSHELTGVRYRDTLQEIMQCKRARLMHELPSAGHAKLQLQHCNVHLASCQRFVVVLFELLSGLSSKFELLQQYTSCCNFGSHGK